AIGGVVDLTHSIQPRAHSRNDRSATSPENPPTRVAAPAEFVRGAWTVDEIPVGRLIAPLVVLDVRKSVEHDSDYQVGMSDLTAWEEANGPLPVGAVVVARTGWSSRWYSPRQYRNEDANGVTHFPGFSVDAVKFLVDARKIVALGTDTPGVDPGSSQESLVRHFTASHQVYHLENIANLDKVPDCGATAVIAPAKLRGGSGAPVRMLALLK